MLDEAVLHPVTKQLLMSYLQTGGGLLLSAPDGAGKEYVATQLAAALTGRTLTTVLTYAYWYCIKSAASALSIDQIRELQKELRLRAPKSATRVVTIIDAHTLTHEAQNALLKTLEEPPERTHIILTTDSSDLLLPTIKSRLQTIRLIPPPSTQIQAAFQHYDKTLLAKHMAIADGRVGLLHSLLHDQSHPLIDAIQTAKTLIAAQPFERLCHTEQIIKDKPGLLHIIDALTIIHKTLLHMAISDKKYDIQSLIKKLELLEYTKQCLLGNVQAKLAVDNLLINL